MWAILQDSAGESDVVTDSLREAFSFFSDPVCFNARQKILGFPFLQPPGRFVTFSCEVNDFELLEDVTEVAGN